MNIYRRKYNLKKLAEELQKSEKKTANLDELFYLLGYDPIDIYYFYINNVKGRIRYDKNYNSKKEEF
jgi:hypothetical protein